MFPRFAAGAHAGIAAFATLFIFLDWSGANTAKAGDLHDAVRAGDATHVQALLLAGANVNELDSFGSPLHLAAARGSVEIATVLIDAGANLEAKASTFSEKAHPLHTAAVENQVAVAALLIERGAKVDSRNAEGMTPLLVAASNGNVEVAALLLKAGADPLAEDVTHQQTPIHFAAVTGKLEFLKLILANGIDINLRSTHNGETPLYYATRQSLMSAEMDKRIQAVEFLLANGADPNVADKDGKTPYQIAQQPKVRELLLKFGAKE